MYRLTLYGLALLALVAVGLSWLGLLPLSAASLAFSALLLWLVCQAVNRLLAYATGAPRNLESASITAFILFFVMTPATNSASAWALVISASIAMVSKYLLAVRGKHIFNPAAFGAVAAAWLGFGSSSWWVSSLIMLPFVLIFGLLLVRKLRRFEMLGMFLVVSLTAIIIFAATAGNLSRIGLAELLIQAVTVWPLVFFGTVMFTEPLTTPPTRTKRLVYGLLAGALFGTPFHEGSFYLTSELALALANLYSFTVSLKQRMTLTLVGKRELAPSIFECSFRPDRPLKFIPGQYLEWTLPHKKCDSRGLRRYFTIASSPTEESVKLAAKIAGRASSFKRALLALEPGRSLAAGQLAGDFILPHDPDKPLVFIAGGIGVTPFRSMVKYLLDTRGRRDIVFFYACANPAEFVYQDIFAEAASLGVKTIYLLSGATPVPSDWQGRTGFIDRAMIEAEAPDYLNRLYYISGPPGMVKNYVKLLHSLGIKRGQIKTDYFPGY